MLCGLVGALSVVSRFGLAFRHWTRKALPRVTQAA
jgi:hypothetical protein